MEDDVDRETLRARELDSKIVEFNQYLEALIDGHLGRGREVDQEHLKFFETRAAEESDDGVRALYTNVRALVQGLLDANQRLAQLATRDPLTGVYNRTFFNEALRLEVADAMRSGGHIMFVMVDIDQFKAVNDTLGHLRGDNLLKEVAAMIEDNVRASDLVIRYGGDEFLVVAPRADEETCSIIMDRLRSAEHEGEPSQLTLSMGCSSWSPGQDVDETIKRADELMYEQKKAKRGEQTGEVENCR